MYCKKKVQPKWYGELAEVQKLAKFLMMSYPSG